MIDENYTELNARVMKSKTSSMNRRRNRSDSDDKEDDRKYPKEKPTEYRSKITSEKLPSINTNRNKAKVDSDEEENDRVSVKHDLNKKKKVLGTINTNHQPMKKAIDNEPKAFRSTYEIFPEETPWSSITMLKPSKSEDMLPRLYTKPSVANETKKRHISPLVHDTKSYKNSSSLKHDDNNSDGDQDENWNPQRKFKTSSSTDRFTSNMKKATSSMDDDHYNNDRRVITTPKKFYNPDDDYSEKFTPTKSNQTYDYQSSHRSKYADDDDYYSTSKPTTRSTYTKDYSTNHSKYNNDEEEDDHRWSSSKPISRSRFEDEKYSRSKSPVRSRYDDDDDYPNSSTGHHYSSTSNTGTSRTRVGHDEFFTTRGETKNTNRFQHSSGYDS